MLRKAAYALGKTVVSYNVVSGACCSQKVSGPGGGGSTGSQSAFQKELNGLVSDGVLSKHHSFKSSDAAAVEVLSVTAPLSKKYGLEVGGSIWKDKKGWHYTTPEIGSATGVGVAGGYIGYHTHTSDGLKFSNAFWPRMGAATHDAGMVSRYNQPLYLGVHYGGNTLIGVCSPGSCSATGRFGTSLSRVLQ
ncbi:hypothetical protein [Marinagarivorans algicola]|uniref:hypothetical protein n=1 Tax=Marinagarivorans algicola TaxID=1513270 RepID=UPI0006B51A16|nr:hypothetical protein [Marinagarivorans algicola]